MQELHSQAWFLRLILLTEVCALHLDWCRNNHTRGHRHISSLPCIDCLRACNFFDMVCPLLLPRPRLWLGKVLKKSWSTLYEQNAFHFTTGYNITSSHFRYAKVGSKSFLEIEIVSLRSCEVPGSLWPSTAAKITSVRNIKLISRILPRLLSAVVVISDRSQMMKNAWKCLN